MPEAEEMARLMRRSRDLQANYENVHKLLHDKCLSICLSSLEVVESQKILAGSCKWLMNRTSDKDVHSSDFQNSNPSDKEAEDHCKIFHEFDTTSDSLFDHFEKACTQSERFFAVFKEVVERSWEGQFDVITAFRLEMDTEYIATKKVCEDSVVLENCINDMRMNKNNETNLGYKTDEKLTSSTRWIMPNNSDQGDGKKLNASITTDSEPAVDSLVLNISGDEDESRSSISSTINSCLNEDEYTLPPSKKIKPEDQLGRDVCQSHEKIGPSPYKGLTSEVSMAHSKKRKTFSDTSSDSISGWTSDNDSDFMDDKKNGQLSKFMALKAKSQQNSKKRKSERLHHIKQKSNVDNYKQQSIENTLNSSRENYDLEQAMKNSMEDNELQQHNYLNKDNDSVLLQSGAKQRHSTDSKGCSPSPATISESNLFTSKRSNIGDSSPASHANSVKSMLISGVRRMCKSFVSPKGSKPSSADVFKQKLSVGGHKVEDLVSDEEEISEKEGKNSGVNRNVESPENSDDSCMGIRLRRSPLSTLTEHSHYSDNADLPSVLRTSNNLMSKVDARLPSVYSHSLKKVKKCTYADSTDIQCENHQLISERNYECEEKYDSDNESYPDPNVRHNSKSGTFDESENLQHSDGENDESSMRTNAHIEFSPTSSESSASKDGDEYVVDLT